MVNPLVTIVTPSYNQGRFIRDTIESVLGQDYVPLEYIVVDGGSTDETLEILRAHQGRLQFICEPDRGQSEAINKGFRKARGEIVCWLNSDDVFLPGAISAVVQAFERDPDVGAVYGDGYLVDVDGRHPRPFPRTGPMNLWRLIHYSAYLLQPAVFFRRSALEEIGYLDEQLHFGMDWDLFIRIGKRYRMQYVPQPLASQREYDVTKTARGGLRRFRELARIMRRHGRLRYPPAYFGYGVDTLHKMLTRLLRSATRHQETSFQAAAEVRLQRVVDWLLGRVHARREEWYGDGWAAPIVHLLLLSEGGDLVLRGEVPPPYAKLREQRIEVRRDGQVLANCSLPTGDFELNLPIDVRAGTLVELELRAAKYFVPKREGINADFRKLAYRLAEVRWRSD